MGCRAPEALEFQYLSELDLEFDLSITGFELPEIDLLIQGDADSDDEADQVPDIDQAEPAVTQPGDLWILGRHRLYCADATKAESFATLLDGELAQSVFVDPPYNVPIDGNVCGLGSIKHREFAMASGEMSEAEFIGFLKTIFGHLTTTASTAQSTLCAWTGATASRSVWPAAASTASSKILRLEQGQWRNGLAVSLQA